MKNGRSQNGPRALDLFCGIGGLTNGLHRAGIQSIGGVDCWTDAAKTFEHNIELPCMVADLTETSAGDVCDSFGIKPTAVDILVGGPPCQGFSTVGKRQVSDPRNQLWSHYLELVNGIRPAYVVIENVEGLVVMEKGEICKQIARSFAEIGYHIKWKLLTSADYGVPQLRKRVIFLGWLAGLQEPSFPKRSPSSPVTVGDAIFDLPPLGPSEAKTEYEEKPSTDYQRARRKDASTLHNHEAANHPPHLVEILRHIPDGGNRKSIPDELQPKSGFHNSYSRLASNKPAVAVTSNMRKPSSARATHPLQHRGLTVREGLRLQSFDDDFVVLGSRTSQYLQAGNAVPPLLAEAIGKQVVEAFLANSPTKIRNARKAPPTRVETPLHGQLVLQFNDSR